MCGRIDQNETAQFYALVFGWSDAVYDSQSGPRYNVSPRTFRPLMHIQDGARRVDDVYWSYRPAWARNVPAPTPGKPARRPIPVAVNAQASKLTGSYWSRLLKGGRAVIGASGWYEWTGMKGDKQPWHIHRQDRAPMFMLCLANFGPAEERPEESGFVIVTGASDGGMIDVHDRRPVVVSAADAALWLDPDLPPATAAELARTAMLNIEEFEWYQVSRAVNPAGSDGPELVVPLESVQ